MGPTHTNTSNGIQHVKIEGTSHKNKTKMVKIIIKQKVMRINKGNHDMTTKRFTKRMPNGAIKHLTSDGKYCVVFPGTISFDAIKKLADFEDACEPIASNINPEKTHITKTNKKNRIHKIKHKIERYKQRIIEYEAKKDDLSNHGYWSLGYFEGRKAILEEILDELELELELESN